MTDATRVATFNVVEPDGSISLWTIGWPESRLARWRVVKAPAGAVPPWRTAAPPAEVLAGEDGRVHGEWAARWWVWPPDSPEPCAAMSSHRAAMNLITDAVAAAHRAVGAVADVVGVGVSTPLESTPAHDHRPPRGTGPDPTEDRAGGE